MKSNKRNLFVAGLLTVALLFTTSTAALAASAPAPALSGKITMSGSTSVAPLAQVLADAFMKKNSKVKIDIQLGGSGVGISDIIKKKVNIGNSSRELTAAEKASAKLNEHVICVDGIAIIVNNANVVKNLSTAMLKKIFTGQVTNWYSVGGPNLPITVVGREAGSGTRSGFEEILGIGNTSKGQPAMKYKMELNSTELVKSTVSGIKGAIGYISLGSLDSTVKGLTLDKIVPNRANIQSKKYTLQRDFLMITNGKESALVQAWFNFVKSAQGKALIEKEHYFVF